MYDFFLDVLSMVLPLFSLICSYKEEILEIWNTLG